MAWQCVLTNLLSALSNVRTFPNFLRVSHYPSVSPLLFLRETVFLVSGQGIWEHEIRFPETFTGGSDHCRLKGGKGKN